MERMEITPQTRLTDIMAAYPKLLDQLTELDGRFALLNTAMGRLLLKKATMQDAADRYHVPVDQLIQMLHEQLDKLDASKEA